MTKNLKLFATTPKGLELLLVEELKNLGAVDAAEKLAGVTFSGDLALAYKACLWSRLANRILLFLTKIPASTPEELYAGVQTIAWDEHMSPHGTLSVNFATSQSNITHTLFGAQKVKDAIVDQFRTKYGVRPSVASKPQLNINVYLHKNEASVSLDLSGESLHKRGYRLSTHVAPLKENLASAILLRAGWPTIAKSGGTLIDPLCGSATLLIEAALMAGNIAPQLSRNYFGFLGWIQHDELLWQTLLREAKECKEKGISSLPTIIGYDQDSHAIKIAFENIERAGLLGKIHVERRELALFSSRQNIQSGLVVTNPPYGERIGEVEELKPLYTLLGDKLKQEFQDWQAAVLTANPELGKYMGLRAKHYYALFNGALPCKLLLFEVQSQYFVDRSPGADNERRIRAAKRAVSGHDLNAIQMFINRLRKNLKHLRRQAIRNGKTSYRVYDADLPDYAFAIDVSDDMVLVQEYPPPSSIAPQKALHRQQEVLAVLPEVMEVPPARIFFTILPYERKLKKN